MSQQAQFVRVSLELKKRHVKNLTELVCLLFGCNNNARLLTPSAKEISGRERRFRNQCFRNHTEKQRADQPAVKEADEHAVNLGAEPANQQLLRLQLH